MKDVFERYELKFVITTEQKHLLMELVDFHMIEDEHGKSSLYNLYYDTKDFLLIRRSIEKPVYKEKLRIRSYGEAHSGSKVFVEIKKKMKKIVYKRRVLMEIDEAMNYLAEKLDNNEYTPQGDRNKPSDDKGDIKRAQIIKEINYFKVLYGDISPRVLIVYDREAFFSKNDKDFRLTFDQNILWSDSELELRRPMMGNLVLEEGKVLMEVKVSGGIPIWLVDFLSENKIYKTSFSKYGNAYKQIIEEKRKKDNVA